MNFLIIKINKRVKGVIVEESVKDAGETLTDHL